MSVVHHHLHARVRTDAAGDELVAGDAHHPARQRHRADPDDPQRPRGHEVRHLVPGAAAARHSAYAAPTCRRCFAPLVACGWFGIQTWIGALALNLAPRRSMSRAGPTLPQRDLVLVCCLLADPGRDHHHRHRGDQAPGELVGAAAARRRPAAALVGVQSRRRARQRCWRSRSTLQGAHDYLLGDLSRGPHRATSATGRR